MSNTITSSLVKKFVPVRKLSSRKGDNGKVLVLGGSYIYHGAPALSSLAALKTGAVSYTHLTLPTICSV